MPPIDPAWLERAFALAEKGRFSDLAQSDGRSRGRRRRPSRRRGIPSAGGRAPRRDPGPPPGRPRGAGAPISTSRWSPARTKAARRRACRRWRRPACGASSPRRSIRIRRSRAAASRRCAAPASVSSLAPAGVAAPGRRAERALPDVDRRGPPVRPGQVGREPRRKDRRRPRDRAAGSRGRRRAAGPWSSARNTTRSSSGPGPWPRTTRCLTRRLGRNRSTRAVADRARRTAARLREGAGLPRPGPPARGDGRAALAPEGRAPRRPGRRGLEPAGRGVGFGTRGPAPPRVGARRAATSPASWSRAGRRRCGGSLRRASSIGPPCSWLRGFWAAGGLRAASAAGASRWSARRRSGTFAWSLWARTGSSPAGSRARTGPRHTK